MIKILIVGVGGFTGAIFRYLISGLIYKFFENPWFPFGTLAVNVLGCLLIGLLGGLSEIRQIFTPEIRLLILIGFLGGFTTFSTFGYEIFTYAREGQVIAAFANLSFHIILGFGAIWAGFSFSKLL